MAIATIKKQEAKVNRTNLLGSLFLRASSVSGGATFGDLLEEIRKLSKKKKRPANPHKSKNEKSSHREDEKNLKAA